MTKGRSPEYGGQRIRWRRRPAQSASFFFHTFMTQYPCKTQNSIAAMLRLVLLAALLLAIGVPISHAENGQERGGSYSDAADSSTKESTDDPIVLDEVVVKGVKIKESTGVSVISREDIENKQKNTVIELLRDIPGIDVVQTGGPGKSAHVYIRGANPEHTLVLIDGVEVSDPMSPARSFDFGYLGTDGIDTIEILRGAQSPLYGANAMGGVINITTRKNKGPISGFVSSEGGSLDSRKIAGAVGGRIGWFNVSVNGSHAGSDGVSAANRERQQKGGGHGFMGEGSTETEIPEPDGFTDNSYSARVEFMPMEMWKIEGFYLCNDYAGDLDDHAGAGGEDPNYDMDMNHRLYKLAGSLRLFGDRWEQTLSHGVSETVRTYENKADPLHHLSEDYGSVYDGSISQDKWHHHFEIFRWAEVDVGIEEKKELGDYSYYSDSHWGRYNYQFPLRTASTTSYYGSARIEFGERFSVTGGLRRDDHSMFDSETTGRIETLWICPGVETFLKASYGTAWKIPSLFQLYSLWGNEDLKPEESTSWDIGVEQALFEGRLRAGVTWFRNDFVDLIDYNYWKGYVNVEGARTEGAEIFLRLELLDDLTLSVNYTHTETEDKTTGEKLLRRPRTKYSANLNYAFTPGRFFHQANFNLNYRYVGEREDWVPWPRRGVVESYSVVDVALHVDINDRLRLFGRIENLLDDEYQEVWGFGVQRRFFAAGLRVSF